MSPVEPPAHLRNRVRRTVLRRCGRQLRGRGQRHFSESEIDPDIARQFPVYGTTVIFVFAFRMAAMSVFTTSAILLRAGIQPRWIAWGGYAVATFLLLSATFERWFVLVFRSGSSSSACCCFRVASRIDPELRLPRAQQSSLLARQARGQRVQG